MRLTHGYARQELETMFYFTGERFDKFLDLLFFIDSLPRSNQGLESPVETGKVSE